MTQGGQAGFTVTQGDFYISFYTTAIKDWYRERGRICTRIRLYHVLNVEVILHSQHQNRNFMQKRGSQMNLKDALTAEPHVRGTVTMANVRCILQYVLNAELKHRFPSNPPVNVRYTAMIASGQRGVAIN